MLDPSNPPGVAVADVVVDSQTRVVDGEVTAVAAPRRSDLSVSATRRVWRGMLRCAEVG